MKRSKQMRKAGVVTALAMTAAVALGACSSDGSEQGRAAPDTTTTATSADTSDLCSLFGDLAASGAGRDAQASPSTAEGWEQRIETTQAIADAAPEEWKDEAETYVQMVKDRAQLAADNGYVAVDDLPADVREAFIAEHRGQQAEVNELIAFMGSECGVSRG
jgi:hypothetical protein